MASDFSIASDHIEYSNCRFNTDTCHMAIIEVLKHIAELPVYAQDCTYRARLFCWRRDSKFWGHHNALP